MLPWLYLALAMAEQAKTLAQGPHRMEIVVERREANAWRAVDPSLVFDRGDRLRFRFRSNFDGYLYVLNHSTSGKYEQLFPRQETGRENRIIASREYLVPATQTAFRIAGPAGHEVLYWMVSPIAIAPQPPPPPEERREPKILIPRCDDAILRARGECIDHSAGPKLVPRGSDLPRNLKAAGGEGSDLVFMRQKNTSVVASPEPLSGPVVYEFRLAHK